MRARHFIILCYMFYMISINAYMLRYCIVWSPSWGPSLWGPSISFSIITLWQPERLKCLFWDDIICVIAIVIWSYTSMIHALHVIDLCSMLRCDTVLYGDHRYGNRPYEEHRYGDHRSTSISIQRYPSISSAVCDSMFRGWWGSHVSP